MNIITLLGIDPTQITMYLDYAFYGVIAMVALGFVFGFLRGIWREGFRLIFVGGLVILSVIFTRDLVNFAMDYELTSLLSSTGFTAISLDLGGGPISVPITTPFETINDLLEQVLLGFGFFITPALSELVIALTLVILRYLIFILLAVVIFLLGESLAALLYFIPFRFFIPSNLRKKKKMRLWGGLAGATKMVLVLTMFLSPFTSLVNTITTSFRDFDNEYGDQIDSELYDQLMGYVNAYENSAFSSVLFDWSISEDGKTIDTVLMDYITGEDIENYRLTLSDELDSIIDIAATLIGTGAIDSTLSTINTSLLLTEDAVTNLLLSLTGSTLVMRIIPIAVAIAFNLEEVKAFVDPELINLNDVDWNEELINIGGIVSSVIRTGVLDDLLVNNAPITDVIATLFTETSQEEVGSILLAIDDSPFLSQVIPAVLYGLVQDELATGVSSGSLGLSTFLPSEWEDYETIAFGSELKLVYDLVYELFNEATGLQDVLLDTLLGGSAASPIDSIVNRPKLEGETPDLTSVLLDNFDLILEVLLGEVDSEGVAINNDPVTGKSINRVSLFDSDLLMRGIPSLVDGLVVPTLLSVLGQDYDDTELMNLIEGFNDGSLGDVRQAYKTEFAGLLSIVGAALNNETLAGLLEPGASINVLDILGDDAFRASLKNDLVPKLDRSEMILTIVPGFLEATFSDPSFDDFLTLINITTADLNFDIQSLSREINIVIDMLGYALPILDVTNDLINQFPTISTNLIGLLDSIYESNILNLNPTTNDKATNYRQMIGGIFSLVEGFGVEESDLDTGFNAVVPFGEGNGWTTVFDDVNNNGLLDEGDIIDENASGENFHLVNFLTAALDSGLLDISGDIFAALDDLASGTEDLSDENVAPLYKIFAYADRSQIIRNSFGGILDTLFGTTGGLLDADLGTSFRNVTSWEEEGSNLIFLVKQLTNFADGLNGIDFLNSDVSLIEELLQGLAASQIFVNQDGTYLFPDFLLNQLKSVADISDFFLDPDPYLSAYDNDNSDNYTIITSDFYAIGDDVETKEGWFGTKEIIVDPSTLEPVLDANGFIQYEYVGGEIENIVGFIEAFQNVSIDDLTSGTNLSGETISDLLLALNDAPSLRVLLYNIYDSIFGTSNFDIGSLSLSDTNIYVFLELDQTGRAAEITATADLLDTIDTMGLSGGGTFDIANFDATTIQTVGDLLGILHDSRLFNTFKSPNSRDLGDLTVFEQAYKFLITTSTLDTFVYDDTLSEIERVAALEGDMVALTNNFGEETADDWSGPTGEIQRFVDIMIAFVNTGIDFTSFGGDSISGLLNTLEGLGKVEDLLLAMNESTIINPAIGNLFGNIFESDSFNINGLNMGDSNTQYFREETSTKEAKGVEISLILDIYWDIQSIGLSGGGAFTSDLINPTLFDGLLTKMHSSYVFNTFKTGNSYVNGDLTVFEQTYRMILNTSTMDTFIYDTDDQTTRLNNLQADIMALNNGFAGSESDDWTTETTGEIDRMISILEAFKATNIDFSSFSGAGSSDVLSNLIDTEEGMAKIENLLLAMNASSVVYPSIPNLFSTMLEGGDFSSVGVDFALANFRYKGLRNDPLNPQIGEVYSPYENIEIESILSIFSTVKVVGNRSYGSIKDLTNEAIDDMANLVTDLYQTQVFHQSGPSTGLEVDPTVFEQMMTKMLVDTGMANLAYDGTVPEDAVFGNETNKAEYLVMNFSTLFPANNTSHFTDAWLDDDNIGEINAFFRIFKELKLALPDVGNASSIDASALSPTAINSILSVLNYASLTADAAKYMVQDAFNTISFSTYTENNERYDLTPRAFILTDLSAMDYSTLPGTILSNGLIYNLMNGFYDEGTESYINVGAGFNISSYLSDGNSLFPLLDLLARSNLFNNDATKILDANAASPGESTINEVGSIKTRALTFYNLLNTANVGKYFDYLTTQASDKELKVVRVENIFSGDFDIQFEAERLDAFITILSDFTSLSDASSLDQYSAEMRQLIELTYDATGNTITDRAFMVSELSAGFFTDIFNTEYALVEDTNAPFFGDASNLDKRINFYDLANDGGDNDFANLNPVEAVGLEGALEFLGAIKAVASSGGTPSAADVAAMQTALTKMGSKADAFITAAGPYPNYVASDYNSWSNQGSSRIGRLFYGARVVTNSGFTNLSNSMLTLTTLPGSSLVATSLSLEPYSSQFVFEIEGEKIQYVFGD